MTNYRRFFLAAALSVSGLLAAGSPAFFAAPAMSAPALAAPPSADEIRAMQQELREFYTGRTGTPQDMEDREALGRSFLERINVDACDRATLRQLNQFLSISPEGRAAALKRFNELAASPDAEGFLALMDAVDMTHRDDRAEMLDRMMAHPGREAAVKETGEIRGLVTVLSSVDAEALGPHRAEILAMGDLFTDDAPMGLFRNATEFVRMMIDAEEVISASEREAIRQRIVAAMKNRTAASEDADSRDAQFLTRSVAYLDGAAMRGQLLNHTAPAIEFTWIRSLEGTPEWTNLADLRGKVVVLDFWATWCGPCIASFPNVRELQAHYKDADVVIVGVTSLQGRHYPVGGAMVDVTGDPDREKALMAEYMAENDITWTVAFGTQDVFNPDYGVRGIPHVAIIGRDGRVRHTGLHPAGPMEKKIERINTLLAEHRES